MWLWWVVRVFQVSFWGCELATGLSLGRRYFFGFLLGLSDCQCWKLARVWGLVAGSLLGGGLVTNGGNGGLFL